MEELTNKKLGSLGERKVGEWAERSGMTVTEPGEDEKGWDLLLEFDLRDDESTTSNEPLDRDSREFKAFAQVKTTSRTPGQWPIKLSNLASLVQHGGPSYLVVLEVDSKDRDAEVNTAYVVHIGRDIIAEVLEKQRELDHERLRAKAEGEDPEPIKLRDYKLSVSYKDYSLSEPSYLAFREAVVEPLQGSPQRYYEWKRQVHETVGYDEQTGMAVATGEFSIRLPEEYQDSPEDYFVDAAFDKVDPMEVTGGEVRKHRFNIPSAPSAIPKSFLIVEPPTQHVEVKFNRPDLGNRITSGGELQRISIPSSDGEQYTAVNLSVGHTDLTYRDKGQLLEVKFGFDIEPGKYRLDELWETAEMASFMREAGENEEDIQVKIRNQDTGDWDSLPTLEISEYSTFADLQSERVDAFISAVRHAHQLANDLDVHQRLEVSIHQLYKYKAALRTYSQMCRVQQGKSTKEGLFMAFEQKPESAEGFLEVGDEACFVDLVSFQLGDQLIVVSFGLGGQLLSLEVQESDTEDERNRKQSAIDQLPGHVEGYELSMEYIFYLQPYRFEYGEDVPGKEVFLENPFEVAVDNCSSILSLTENGQLALYEVD